MGLARPLNQLRESVDTLACVTTATQRSSFGNSPRDQCITACSDLTFPVPGCLAGSQPIHLIDCSTSRRNKCTSNTLVLLSLASTAETCCRFTRLALQWILVKGFRLYSFQLPDMKCPVLLFIVTTSPYQDWVICAPAAFLGCGSRFSGSLSGIEP